jgi:hypothetical protein
MLPESLDGQECHERIVTRVRLAGIRRDPDVAGHRRPSHRPTHARRARRWES